MKSRIVKNWDKYEFPVKCSSTKILFKEHEMHDRVCCISCDIGNRWYYGRQRSWKKFRKTRYKHKDYSSSKEE